MDRQEAEAILHAELSKHRAKPYSDLQALLDRPQTHEAIGHAGTKYDVEAQAFWDSQPGGDIRVVIAIDDGGLSAFVPMTADFIMTPEGRFVGE